MSLALLIPPFKVSPYWRPTEGDDWGGDGGLVVFGSSGELQADTSVIANNDATAIFFIHPSLCLIVPVSPLLVNKQKTDSKNSRLTEKIEPDKLNVTVQYCNSKVPIKEPLCFLHIPRHTR